MGELQAGNAGPLLRVWVFDRYHRLSPRHSYATLHDCAGAKKPKDLTQTFSGNLQDSGTIDLPGETLKSWLGGCNFAYNKRHSRTKLFVGAQFYSQGSKAR